MNATLHKISVYVISIAIGVALIACAGDPMQSGLDPFASMIFKEGTTKMPLNPPNQSAMQTFYVSPDTIFKFEIDTDSILIGVDGVTRYIVAFTSPNGDQQIQYQGIRCDSYQWRLYGTLENNLWRENPLSSWETIKVHSPNRYQAALAKGALCNLNHQEKNITIVLQSLNPKNFTGGTKPTNSNGVIN